MEASSEREAATLLREVAAEFAALPEVMAVVLAGSTGSNVSDRRSDLDLYVYSTHEPSRQWRAELGHRYGNRAVIGSRFWEPGDEWIASQTGIVVDIMYRSPQWIEEQLDRVLVRHEASVGYSTCFLYNVLHSTPIRDRNGWFASLWNTANLPYPEELRRAVIAKNHPILRRTHSSYLHQTTSAVGRGDAISVNHRVAAILASYFDILFAMNRSPHPGEKRLVAHVLASCPQYPPGMQKQIDELLCAVAPTGHSKLISRVNDLLDGLDNLLLAEGLIDPA